MSQRRQGTTDHDEETAADVRAVAAHYGVADRDIALAGHQGQVNLTVFLGQDMVLRIPRTERAEALLPKEVAVIELAESAGVPTSALIDYDPSRRIARVPYVVLTRLSGATLAECWPDQARRNRALGALGEILHTLHTVKRDRLSTISPTIPDPYSFSPSEVLDRLVANGDIGEFEQQWLLEQFTLLRPEGPSQVDPVLVHRDVSPSNVMVAHDGSAVALMDWGCAEWGHSARDLVGVPVRGLPAVLSGYRSAANDSPQAHGADLERDALWYHLYLALARLLKAPAGSSAQDWAAPRSATLIDLFAFAAGEGADEWAMRLRRLSEG